MKTLVAKSIPNKDRKWFIVDAEGKNLGRLATSIARTLSGRNRVDYTPHIDNGDYVVVINAEKIAVTGKKEDTKMYRTHSQYMGGLKEIPLSRMRVKDPAQILIHAIDGMIPHTKHRNAMLLRLKVQAGATHAHEAQKPTPLPEF